MNADELDAFIRRRCRQIARRAKLRGELTPQPCARCGEGLTEMLHADYSEPLNVQWLCRSCHRDVGFTRNTAFARADAAEIAGETPQQLRLRKLLAMLREDLQNRSPVYRSAIAMLENMVDGCSLKSLKRPKPVAKTGDNR